MQGPGCRGGEDEADRAHESVEEVVIGGAYDHQECNRWVGQQPPRLARARSQPKYCCSHEHGVSEVEACG